jgi:hypothetical protein
MKYIKTFGDFLNESKVNESYYWETFPIDKIIRQFKKDNRNKGMSMRDINNWFDMFAQEYNIADSIPSDVADELEADLKREGYKNADSESLQNPNEQVASTTNSSDINESSVSGNTVWEIASPATKSTLVDDLKGILGNKFEYITNFKSPDDLESVIVFNLSTSDIKKIKNESEEDILIFRMDLSNRKEI